MAGIAHIPWYATFFRGDRFAQALAEIAPVAMRYGARDYEVRRSSEDRYKFFQTATFEDKADFYAYWEGPEFVEWRARYGSWFQVPVVYDFYEQIIHGGLGGNGNGNGHAATEPATHEHAAD